jgi:hypothetical protein
MTPGWNADGSTLLIGGSGRDIMQGFGDARIFGNDGRDSLRIGAGPVFASGGPGVDDVMFWNEEDTGVTVRLDNRANDGSGGQRANVRVDVENVYGTYGSDEIWGAPGIRNFIDGRDGDDEIHVASAVADRDSTS